MAEIKNILVPIDGSSNSLRGLDKAVSIAKSSGATITGLFVFHLPLVAGLKLTKSMENQAKAKGQKAIGGAQQKAERQGVPFKWKTAGGKPGDAIVNVAKGVKADIIVIGARGLGATKEKFLGSTSNHVMHKSQIPVLVVK